MFRYNTCLVFFVFICTEPVFGAEANNIINCSANQFSCGDGSCIELNAVRDGYVDCTDHSDERACNGLGDGVSLKRQASSCRGNQWQCRDCSCIAIDAKCNGVVDCPDGSDETFPLCRRMRCQSDRFRCAYGACVDESAPCNGVRDCADNSDELLPRCRNATYVMRGNFYCANWQVTYGSAGCDGVRHCADGTDETLEVCAAFFCSGHQFQCAYGACVAPDADCNGKQECVDGSDESDELCEYNKPSQGGKCDLPPYPQFGKYLVANIPGAGPGEAYPSVVLNVTCNPGFGVEGMRDTVWCYAGVWSAALPRCTEPVFGVVANNIRKFCTINQFSCGDGSCISLNGVRDGYADCTDHSDERACNGLGDGDFKNFKRQASSCRGNLWQCRDCSCIAIDAKCNGVVDCPDGSDETLPLCRRMRCESDRFRCTYGACVDGSAPCNGVRDCADNSDELLPRCRNVTYTMRGNFYCANGQVTHGSDGCDGVRNCADGTDETLEACAATSCDLYYRFQCAYGACVAQAAKCNGTQECADGSDESDELCNRNSPGILPVTPTFAPPTNKPAQRGKCALPPYPQFGKYLVANIPDAAPGEAYPSVVLNVTCNPGFGVEGMRDTVWCYAGVWSDALPRCVRFCRLNKHPSVEYRCISTGAFMGSRECGPLEPAGTIVQPNCRTPNYYFPGVLSNMNCIDGYWDYIALCKPECGIITRLAKPLIIGGRTAKKGELPWHAGIYDKLDTPYMQVCGGSLISTTAVISAAHCFWSDSEKKLPAEKYSVAVGKLYRPWNNVKDEGAQKSDVAEIKLAPRYQGAAANYQDDIAIVIVATPFTYQPTIRPVCINFDVLFDLQQMTPGTLGKVAGWGLTTAAGGPSQILKVVEMPMVGIDECRARLPASFHVHLTSDKICAGYTNGTTLCQGDSGGGLAVPAVEQAAERHYLRGVVSVSPVSDDAVECNQHTLVAFTQITKHEHFIKPYL